jgi:hypothetical protein
MGIFFNKYKANTMTPEKLQSIAFKWFETFNNKELENLFSMTMRCGTLQSKTKTHK